MEEVFFNILFFYYLKPTLEHNISINQFLSKPIIITHLNLISSSYCLSQLTIPQLPIPVQQSQWHKAKVAYLGNSITNKRKIGTKKLYWEHLQDMFDIESFVYGQSVHTWKDFMKQAEELKNANITDLSAIFIFAGTNDYNANLEIGTLYNESLRVTNHNGEQVERKYRESNYDDKTFYGRINNVLLYLKRISLHSKSSL